jgi:anti-sigma-K factor RskA
MTEIHALSGAYVVDALDDVERARFERHLAECADCRAEVASLRETAALLPEVHATAPAPTVRAQVLAAIGTVRPLPPARRPVPVVRRWSTRLLAAAAVVLVVGFGAVALHPSSHDQGTSADKVLTASDAVRVEHQLPGGGSVTVVDSARLGRAVVITRGVPEPPAGKTYQLWLQTPDNRMVPAGLIGGGDRTVLMQGDSSRSVGAGITVEPAGGSDEPTSTPLALFSFGSA